MWSHWKEEQGGAITPQAHLWDPDMMLTLYWRLRVCMSNGGWQSCGPTQPHCLLLSLLRGGPKSCQNCEISSSAWQQALLILSSQHEIPVGIIIS